MGASYLTTTIEAAVLTAYRCTTCGHEEIALVRSIGEGKAAVGLFNEAEARETSRAKADEDLRERARSVASMARCPACNSIDGAAISRARTASIAKGLLIALGALAFAWISSGGKWDRYPEVFAVIVGAGALFAVFTIFKGSWQWTEVDERVAFVEPEALPEIEARLKAQHEGRREEPEEEPAEAAPEVGAGWTLAPVWGEALSEAKITWPFVGDLELGLLRHGDEGPMWLEESDLGGLALADARALAHRNLETGTAALNELEHGVFTGDWGDGFAASRLALPARFADLKLEGRPVAFTASEDTLFIAGEQDAVGLQRAFHLSAAHARSVLADESSSAGRFTAQPWVLTERGWEPWALPPLHVLGPLVQELDRELGVNAWRFTQG